MVTNNPFAPLERINYKKTIVPVVQALLVNGLSKNAVKRSARIGHFAGFSGGMKAKLVGELRIDFNLVLKLGDEELLGHQELMNAVNAGRPRTFPEVFELVHLDEGKVPALERDERYVLLMEDFVGFHSVADRIYEKDTSLTDIDRLASKAIEWVLRVHRSGFDRLPPRADPYTTRIIEKMEFIGTVMGEAAEWLNEAGTLVSDESLAGEASLCPSWPELQARLQAGLPGTWEPVPVHGDPHIGNVMVRRHGSRGWATRLIDPNTTVGLTDPLYDLGKLLHWADPVGWARVRGWHGDARLTQHADGWRLTENRSPLYNVRETRRARLYSRLRERQQRFGDWKDPGTARRLQLSIASAHIGMAFLLATQLEERREQGCSSTEQNEAALRFVLFHFLRRMAKAYPG